MLLLREIDFFKNCIVTCCAVSSKNPLLTLGAYPGPLAASSSKASQPNRLKRNKKGILSLICGVENSIYDKVFAFSHPFCDKVFAFSYPF